MKLSLIGGSLIVFLALTAHAQQATESSFVGDAKDNAVRVYTQTIGDQAHLYEGTEYKDNVRSIDEYPYLHDDVMYGNVKYAGELYLNIPLYYDLEIDHVITQYPQGNKVKLLPEKVEYFEIADHKYVRLDNNKVTTGFYDLRYDGKMKFYVKASKVLLYKVNSNGGEPHYIFEKRIKYLIMKNGSYHTVKSKRSVMNLVSDKKKDIKRRLRAEKVVFNRDREKAISFVLAAYEQTQ